MARRLLAVCCLFVPLAAQGAAPAWVAEVQRELKLDQTRLADTTVYYDPRFKPQLEVLEAAYRQYVASPGAADALAGKRDAILADLRTLLGIPDARSAETAALLDRMLAVARPHADVVYLIAKTSVKDYLRGGGTLPGMDYDRATDKVNAFLLQAQELPDGGTFVGLTLPVGSPETVKQELSALFEGLRRGDSEMPGSVLHEVVAEAVNERIRLRGRYGRWFTDGAANVVTRRLLERHAGAAAAEQFAKGHDPAAYGELAAELDLAYWNYPLYALEPPVPSEGGLTAARYAHATLEVEGLVQRHGSECLARILDELDRGAKTGEPDVLRAVKTVTEEDPLARLGRYQNYETREEGRKKYALRFNAATDAKEPAKMLFSLARIHELREDGLSPDALRDYSVAARLLLELGQAEAADRTMRKSVVLFRQAGKPEAFEAAAGLFLAYCIDRKRPDHGLAVADELLGASPEHDLALTVKLLALERLGRHDDAAKLAQLVVKSGLAKDAGARGAADAVLKR